jgi:hypothetical protein
LLCSPNPLSAALPEVITTQPAVKSLSFPTLDRLEDQLDTPAAVFQYQLGGPDPFREKNNVLFLLGIDPRSIGCLRGVVEK